MEPAGLLSYEKVADRLGVSERTVRRMVNDGKIPYVQIEGRVLFDPVDIDRWIAEKKVGAP